MKSLRQRKYLIAPLALVLIFAGCKGESPTAPPVVSPPGGGGLPGTPPTAASITLTVSTATPLAGSSSIITATVTQGGTPVANGTAVEFSTTSPSTFVDTGTQTTVRTTTNGVANASVTSPTPTTATIRAIVNNVSAQTTVTFQAVTTQPPPADNSPAITSFTPVIGTPVGGELITIRGRNFRSPVKVFFDFGNGLRREAVVASVTPDTITVFTPQVDLGAGQSRTATIQVFFEQGTPNERAITLSTPFTFQRAQLTPVITGVSPASGPIDGGTRVTIFGEGFEPLSQVFFGAAEAQIINITFSQIVVMTPPARDTASDGSGAVTGPVAIRIVNIASGGTTGTLAAGFRYVNKMQITAAGPTEGLFTGGTRVRIDGTGFDQPVAVSIGGFAAQPVFVSGSQIIAVTPAVNIRGCTEPSGPIQVTNIDNGDSATGPTFTYRVPRPAILSVSPGALGGTMTITVMNAYGIDRLRIGTTTVSINSAAENPDGTTTFTVTVPPTLQLQTRACPALPAVSTEIPTAFDVVYTSLTTECTDTMTAGAIISPPAAGKLTFNPLDFTPFTATIVPASPGPPPTPATVRPSATQTLNVANTGAGPMTINSVTTSGAGCTAFNITTPSTPATLATCEVRRINATYTGTTTPQTHTCDVTVNTTAGVQTFTLVGTSQ